MNERSAPAPPWLSCRITTGSRLVVSALLTILVLSIHAPHFFGPAADAADAVQSDHLLHTPLTSEGYPVATDCPLPDALLPLLDDVLGELAAAPSTAVFPVLDALFDGPDVRPSLPRAPRPQGPTRQAILKRFIL